jgi:hypothetical protein
MPLGVVDKSQFELERDGCIDTHTMDITVGNGNNHSNKTVNEEVIVEIIKPNEIIETSAPKINYDEIFGNDGRGSKATGRGIGKTEVPECLRKVIAGEYIEGGDISSIEEAFKISRSSISAYVKGANSTTTYDKVIPSLTNHNKNVKEKIVRMTRRKARLAVRMITDDKLVGCNAVQLASVAGQMSKIAIDNEMDMDGRDNKSVTVITYRPRIRAEDTFDVISVSE